MWQHSVQTWVVLKGLQKYYRLKTAGKRVFTKFPYFNLMTFFKSLTMWLKQIRTANAWAYFFPFLLNFYSFLWILLSSLPISPVPQSCWPYCWQMWDLHYSWCPPTSALHCAGTPTNQWVSLLQCQGQEPWTSMAHQAMLVAQSGYWESKPGSLW